MITTSPSHGHEHHQVTKTPRHLLFLSEKLGVLVPWWLNSVLVSGMTPAIRAVH